MDLFLIYAVSALIFAGILLASEEGRSFLEWTIIIAVFGGLAFLCAWSIGGDAFLGNAIVGYLAKALPAAVAFVGFFVALHSIVLGVIRSGKKMFPKGPASPRRKAKPEIEAPAEYLPEAPLYVPEVVIDRRVEEERNEIREEPARDAAGGWAGLGRIWDNVGQYFGGIGQEIKTEIAGKEKGTIEVAEWSRKDVSVKDVHDKYHIYKVLALAAVEVAALLVFLFFILSALFR
ncbi:MAG: hypothetical protein MUD10_00935 [Candidatus Pacebacteria bacterium]|jgi:hypothetical protein|nr:hypothetical protein [Candidatus Paceibacterota bacterium]